MASQHRPARSTAPSWKREWDHADWGTRRFVTVTKTPAGLMSVEEAVRQAKSAGSSSETAAPPSKHASLDQFRATAIAGNDLLSSCLYTAGLCAQYAGPLAPIALLLVTVMLGFFRHIYAEVVTAMPVNGGSYNALLNTTSKRVASIAACLSMLSYIATAVVSAYSAVQYMQPVWDPLNNSDVAAAATVIILGIFALLTLIGIGESSVVAVLMFFLHVTALTVLIIMAAIYAFQDGWNIFRNNVNAGFPQISPNDTGNAGYALFLGYAAALLGITGFETAANYVEDMKDAKTYVFTLRNMWLASGIYNPLISLFAMAVMPMSQIYDNSSNLLAPMAQVVGGDILHVFICADGMIVLAGSVLTAYVGITGLVRRLALDRCLPEIFMRTNKLRGTTHWVIIGFFLLTSSLFLALGASSGGNGNEQMDNLSGVYDMAFLSVMSAFALSCLVLKVKRPDLPRLTITSPYTVLAALAMVLTGLAGTIIKGPSVLAWFFLYFVAVLLVVMSMFERTKLLKLILYIARSCLSDKRRQKREARKQERLQRAHARAEAARLQEHTYSAVGLHVSWGPENNTSPRANGGPLAINGDMAEASGSGDTLSDGSGAFPAPKALRPDEVAVRGARPVSYRGWLASRFSTALGLGEATTNGNPRKDLSEELLPLSENGHVAPIAGENGYALAGGAGAAAEEEEDDVAEAAAEALGGNDEEGLDPRSWRARVLRGIKERIRSINDNTIVYFAKDADLVTLNKAILYVRDNEQTARMCVVHVVDDRQALEQLERQAALEIGTLALSPAQRQTSASTPTGAAVMRSMIAVQPERAAQLLSSLPPVSADVRLLMDNVALLDAIYPKLRIDCLVVRGTYFAPPVVPWLANYLHAQPNMMFMAMPDAKFEHHFAALGGARLITRSATGHLRQRHVQHMREVLAVLGQDVAQIMWEESERAAAAQVGLQEGQQQQEAGPV